MSSFKSRVTKIVVEQLGVDEDKVVPEASFTELGADSLDNVELVMSFEEEFGVSIEEEEVDKIGTVGDAIKYLEQKVSEAERKASEKK